MSGVRLFLPSYLGMEDIVSPSLGWGLSWLGRGSGSAIRCNRWELHIRAMSGWSALVQLKQIQMQAVICIAIPIPEFEFNNEALLVHISPPMGGVYPCLASCLNELASCDEESQGRLDGLEHQLRRPSFRWHT